MPLSLHEETLETLRHSKNLLAFSGGGDSTALFFLLKAANIPFDIAFVNYKTRPQSDEEEAYVRALAKEYHKHYYLFTTSLSQSNFEHQARLKRYHFFETIIETYGYETLLCAHHLGDRLEWLLMQLCKGAGLVELLGMRESEERPSYRLIRPLLHLPKESLLNYLDAHSLRYFHDESNDDTSYTRNHIRHSFANPLLQEHFKGIARSFDYLEEDAKYFTLPKFHTIEKLCYFKRNSDDGITIRAIDYLLKRMGKLISAKEREELLKAKSCVIAHTFAVELSVDWVFIAPYTHCVMEKKFKEECRKKGIPQKIRPYLYAIQIDVASLRLDHTV